MIFCAMKPTQFTAKEIGQLLEHHQSGLREQVVHFIEFEDKLSNLLEKYGFQDIGDFRRKKTRLAAKIRGREKSVQYRRRTPEDEEKIRIMTEAGQGTSEIARELELASNTVTNVKRALKERGALRPPVTLKS